MSGAHYHITYAQVLESERHQLLDILHKMTVSNCILSRKVKNYNALVQKCDNMKNKKYSNKFLISFRS